MGIWLMVHRIKTPIFNYLDEWKRWRTIFFVVGVPCIAFGHFSAFRPMFFPYEGEDPHARPEFVPYEYLRIRTKVRCKKRLQPIFYEDVIGKISLKGDGNDEINHNF